MVDKPDAIYTFGMELEGTNLKCAQISKKKGKPHIENLFEATQEQDDFIFLPNTQTKISDISNHYLFISTLQTHEVLVRPLEIKLKKEKDIDAVLAFQAEPLLPYPIENALLDRIKVGPTSEGTLLTLLAARKDLISDHLEKWRSWHIEPEVVSCVPAALTSYAKFYYPLENYYFLIHFGRSLTTCMLISEGKLLAAQSFSKGINHLKESFEKDCSLDPSKTPPPDFDQIDFSTLSAIKYPTLFESKETLRLEILRILYSLSKQTKGKAVEELIITGEGALYPLLVQNICQDLNKKQATPNANAEGIIPSDLHKYAVPLGAALSGLSNGADLVNFRQGDLAYPYPWKRFKKPLFLYFCFSLLLAIMFYAFGEAYLSYEQDSIRKEYVQLLAIMNKPYTAFEEEFRIKFPFENSSEEDKIPAPQDLSMEDLQKRMRFLEKELQSSPDTFPLLPNVPRVSDVLAWLSTHPTLSSNPSTSTSPAIQIESFNYTMVKRPEQTKKQEKYQVKVELEFSTSTPKQAREFHDALIAPNDFVDPKGEIKWSSNRGKYRTSFFLKDKTVYPSPS